MVAIGLCVLPHHHSVCAGGQGGTRHYKGCQARLNRFGWYSTRRHMLNDSQAYCRIGS